MPTPQPAPPAQPPVVVQQQQQNQQQQNQPANDVIINDTSNNDTRSRSEAENTNLIEGVQSNTQIINNNNSVYQYERGIRIPTTTLNLTGYVSDYDYGIQFNVSVPIGGKSKALAMEQVNTRITETRVNNVAAALSVCASLRDQGYRIVDYDALGLGDCTYLEPLPELGTAEGNEEYKRLIEDQQAAIQKQQVLIQKLLVQIEAKETEVNQPFNSKG